MLEIWEAKDGKILKIKITDSKGNDHIIEFKESVDQSILHEFDKIKDVTPLTKIQVKQMNKRKRFEKENDITLSNQYRIPVLDIIKELGGRVIPSDVYKRIVKKLPLKTKDYAKLHSGEVRYKEMVRHAIASLREEGILKKDKRGIWEFSEKKYIEEKIKVM